VDTVNQYFGHQLRRELVEFIDKPELLRNRVPSTGSERLSSDSTGPANIVDPDIRPAILLQADMMLSK
jgi:hypothetical protein